MSETIPTLIDNEKHWYKISKDILVYNHKGMHDKVFKQISIHNIQSMVGLFWQNFLSFYRR